MKRKTQPTDTFTGALVDVFKQFNVNDAIVKVGKIAQPGGTIVQNLNCWQTNCSNSRHPLSRI